MKLNLGCGRKNIANYINADKELFQGTDMLLDLNICLPFKDNSIETIWLDNVLEHVDNPVKAMEEFHRVLMHNGIIEIKVPHASSPDSLYIFHKSYWFIRTFDYFDKDDPSSYMISAKTNFKIVKWHGISHIPIFLFPFWLLEKFAVFFISLSKMSREYYETNFSRYFPIREFYVKLIKK